MLIIFRNGSVIFRMGANPEPNDSGFIWSINPQSTIMQPCSYRPIFSNLL